MVETVGRAATLADLERAARRRLPRLAYDFVAGGSGEELTLRRNRAAFERVELSPRQLVDVSVRDQSTTVLGEGLATPVLIAPTGMARIAGRGGDLAGVRAAGAAGTVFTLSAMSNSSLEQAAAAASGPLWFQLYLSRDRDLVEATVERARRAGYRALVVTTDVPVVGRRARDLRNGFSLPVKPRPGALLDVFSHPRWLAAQWPPPTFANYVGTGVALPRKTVAHARYLNETLFNPGAGWEDLRRLRELWPGALLVKGVLAGAEAERAVEHGVDGIIVSNHGGRQLDGAPATLAVLAEVVAAVAGRAEVLLDGGVRSGADVVAAVALGARACLVGRPWLYGLAAGGEAGVAAMFAILRAEIDVTLALLGRPRLGEVDRDALRAGGDTVGSDRRSPAGPRL
ncbi:MAG TPA: alpha-hydroxy acid oxidase [Solirubrobacterales bacterium]|nr:alpha-hydroxy acid oxidase [Solirubrobacterales bacterium]